MTMQAFSEEDRKLWMEALDGKEAVSIILKIFFYSVMGNSHPLLSDPIYTLINWDYVVCKMIDSMNKG